MTIATLSLFKEYLLLEKKLSKHSVDAYIRDVKKFLNFIEQNQISDNFGDINRSDVDSFIANLYDMALSKSSQQRTISGIKAFFNFLVLNEMIETSPFRLVTMPKSERKLPDTLSVDDVFGMLETVDLSTKFGHRNRAILELLYSCGLRVSELCDLKIKDVLFEDQLLRVTGKGDKTRIVPIGEIAIEQLKLYLQGNDDHNNGTIFISNKGGKLTRVQVFNIVRTAALNAGIKKNVSPHTLRHCYASHLLANGANLRIIQALLGHESISTTEIYTHVEISQLKQAVELLPVKAK